jgi:O-acetyl-ADP-ribose deacetylase (regulator of RNase III)
MVFSCKARNSDVQSFGSKPEPAKASPQQELTIQLTATRQGVCRAICSAANRCEDGVQILSGREFVDYLAKAPASRKSGVANLWAQISKQPQRLTVVPNSDTDAAWLDSIYAEKFRRYGLAGTNGCPERPAFMQSISVDGTANTGEVLNAKVLPRGSALATSAGQMGGIKAIIHAAGGAMTRQGPAFDPNARGVFDSVRNAIALAQQKTKCLAIPFLGSGIFLDSIGLNKEQLALRITKTALANQGSLPIVLVGYSDEDVDHFQAAHRELGNPSRINVVKGSITDFATHNCEAIVNAANMEVQFGGGLSGVIGKASKQPREIDAEAARLIADYTAYVARGGEPPSYNGNEDLPQAVQVKGMKLGEVTGCNGYRLWPYAGERECTPLRLIESAVAPASVSFRSGKQVIMTGIARREAEGLLELVNQKRIGLGFPRDAEEWVKTEKGEELSMGRWIVTDGAKVWRLDEFVHNGLKMK